MIYICRSTTHFRLRSQLKSISNLTKLSSISAPSTSYKMVLQYHTRDPNTVSNYHEYLTTHITANFLIDFDKKCLTGNVVLKLKAVENTESKKIILDTSYLTVQDVKVAGKSFQWKLSPRSEPYGSSLEVHLAKPSQSSEIVEVDVS